MWASLKVAVAGVLKLWADCVAVIGVVLAALAILGGGARVVVDSFNGEAHRYFGAAVVVLVAALIGRLVAKAVRG